MGTKALATGLSQAELAPSDANAAPYANAGKIDRTTAERIQFTDGQGVKPVSGKAPPEIDQARVAARDEAVEAAIAAQKKPQKAPTKPPQGNGWKELWGKNMHRWRNALNAVPAAIPGVPGMLSGAQSAPSGENA